PVSPRGAADVEVAVGSGNGGQTGVFCVAFEDEKGSPLAVVKTDEHGGYTGGIDLGLLPFGRSTVVARIELPGSSAGDAPYTETRVTAHRESYTALLLVTDDCGIGETAVYGAAFDMLSRIDMPSMRIAVGEEEGELVIEFAPSFRVIQNKQYKLYAAYASARLAVRRGGDVLFSCGSEEYKDMVLNALQAKQRAFKRLLEALKNDESLRHALQNELSTLLVH
ncbi:MAG: hypothetical protein JXQ30_05250, partial [Spirochaetes bacterium]|nr:hypothetical protein [Spirochaetota bacterium]